jgi:hypothetical protein
MVPFLRRHWVIGGTPGGLILTGVHSILGLFGMSGSPNCFIGEVSLTVAFAELPQSVHLLTFSFSMNMPDCRFDD